VEFTGEAGLKQRLIESRLCPSLAFITYQREKTMANRNPRNLLAIFIGSALILSGCAVPDPQRVYASKGDDAKLTFRSANMPMRVEFGLSSSSKSCEAFEQVGHVRDDGKHVLLPWIVNLTSKFDKTPTSLEALVPANRTVQVKGYGSWDGGRCGPLVAKFSADAAAAYLVEFVWSGTSACSMLVWDVTIPADTKSVAYERLFCPRSIF
jgi:hypothetical protein